MNRKRKSKRRFVSNHFVGHSRHIKLSWSGYGSKSFGGSKVLVENILDMKHWETENSLMMN